MRNKLAPSASSVAPGQVATFDFTLGESINVVHLELGDNGAASAANEGDLQATIDALIGDVEVNIGGDTVRIHTGAQLDQMNGSNGEKYLATATGTPGTAGYRVRLPIYFEEPWRESSAARASGRVDLDVGVKSFQVRVTLKPGVVAPVLSAFYEFEPVGDRVFSGLTRYIRQNLVTVGTDNDHPLKDRKGYLQALYLFPTSDGKFVERSRLKVNGTDFRDYLNTRQNAHLLQKRDLNPDTSAVPRYDHIIDYRDDTNHVLPLNGLNSLELKTEYSAASSGTLPAIFLIAGGRTE